MNTQTIERIDSIAEALSAKEEFSIAQIAEELAKDLVNPDIEEITVNLFYRALAEDFDFSKVLIVSEEVRKLYKIYNDVPYTDNHGGIIARLHNQEFAWPGCKLNYFYTCDGGIKAAIREICLQNFFYQKNITPDYEEMFKDPMVLSREYPRQLELSEKQHIYISDKYMLGIQRIETSFYTGIYSKWVKELPEEYRSPESNQNTKEFPKCYITKEALIDYIITPRNYIDWGQYPVFYANDNSKHITTILRESNKYHEVETNRFILALAKHLFISKDDLLHWAQLGRNRSNATVRNEYTYPSISFLGDIWENTPFTWNPDITDNPHLSLKDAWKYYSDSHLWTEYVTAKARFESKLPVYDADKATIKPNYENAYEELKTAWLEHFRRGKLKMFGYKKDSNLERVDIDTDRIESLLSSNRFDFESNEINGGKITGIKVYKVPKRVVSIDLQCEPDKESAIETRQEALKTLIPNFITECVKQHAIPNTKTSCALKLLKYGIANGFLKEGKYTSSTIARDLSDIGWKENIKPALQKAKKEAQKTS